MGVLRLASTATTKLDLGDGDFIEVRTDLSRQDYNGLLRSFPDNYDADKGFSTSEALDFGSSLFKLLVTGWSLDGVAPTVDNYLALERNGSNVVDEKLVEHFNSLLASPTETKSSARSGK